MIRRFAAAAFLSSLALPASALATENGAAADAGSAARSTMGIISASSNGSGSRVTVRLRWDKALFARKGSQRLHLRLLAHSENGHTRYLGSVTRKDGRRTSETVTMKLNRSAARALKASPRVTVSATQQYDSRVDRDRLYERNRISVKALRGKSGAPQGRGCSQVSVNAGGKVTGTCGLQGAFLSNADLRRVSLAGAHLEGGSLAGANLRTTNLSGASLINVSTKGAAWPADEQGALTLPDDGQQIVSAINKAKSRVDVVIYTFGGPDLVGQASAPGALMKAISRGVDVRIMLNSGNKGCKSLSAADQQACMTQSEFDPTFAIQQSLQAAQQNPLPASQGGTGKAGDFEIRYSSQNFQITHQKTILIDAFDGSGKPNVNSGTLALVSTGNLSTYDWGSSYKNASYLTDPAAGCGGAKCADDWAARDFTILVDDKALLERIAAVYASDANCETWQTSPIYRQLLDSTMADTWANGTLLADGSAYPSMGTTAFYGGDSINPGLQSTPQGNSRSRTIRLIDSAQKSLIVYNEEMADPDVMNALVRASRDRKVDVSVVMASSICKTSTVKDPCVPGQPVPSTEFDYLTANGVSVTLLNNSVGLYIHAKAIVADGTDGFMGSENFGYGSMNYNRELGLMLTNRPDPTKVASGVPSIESVEGIAQIQSAFAQDSDTSSGGEGGIVYQTSKVYPTTPPTVQAYPWPQNKQGTAYSDFNVGCGPLVQRPSS